MNLETFEKRFDRIKYYTGIAMGLMLCLSLSLKLWNVAALYQILPLLGLAIILAFNGWNLWETLRLRNQLEDHGRLVIHLGVRMLLILIAVWMILHPISYSS